ncbi:MAG: ECF transporter S component [Clostridia bacterium]|nr:ECF transporter S component [Clostridia bacterium]
MNIKQNYKIAYSALFTAIIILSNLLLKIPIPGGEGYLNISDAFIIICCFLLPAPFGITASLLGSGLSDLISGYAFYIPGTLVAKLLPAAATYIILKKDLSKKKAVICIVLLVSEILSAGIYFLYDYLVIKLGPVATLDLFYNLIQGVVSVILAVALHFTTYKFKNKVIK